MGSSRLPGKVLMKVGGEPLLSYIYNRLHDLKARYPIVVATTNNPGDDILARFCTKHNIKFWRGSEFDVLERFYQLSKIEKFDIIVRLNADCPFLDARFIEDKIRLFLEKHPQIDYASTILDETYPTGMHVEIMTMDALTRAQECCKNSELREHVTPYIYQNLEQFSLYSIRSELNNSDVRLTIDYPEDIAFVNEILIKLRARKQDETVENIIRILRHSDILGTYNQHLKKDQKISLKP